MLFGKMEKIMSFRAFSIIAVDELVDLGDPVTLSSGATKFRLPARLQVFKFAEKD